VADLLSPTQPDQLRVAGVAPESAIGPYLTALRNALKRETCVMAGKVHDLGGAFDARPQPARYARADSDLGTFDPSLYSKRPSIGRLYLPHHTVIEVCIHLQQIGPHIV